MAKLCTKLGVASFFPTPAEVVDGVQWLRKNSVIAVGIAVGLTCFTIAKYNEDDEGSDTEGDDHNSDIATTTLQLGLHEIDTIKKDQECSATNSSVSTECSRNSVSGLRLSSSLIFDKFYEEELSQEATQDFAVDHVWSCLHEGDCPPGEQCCDPDWGWSVPFPTASSS